MASYPIPDPAWDYAPQWHNLHRAAAEIQEAIALIQNLETATPETDHELARKLARIRQRLRLDAPARYRVE